MSSPTMAWKSPKVVVVSSLSVHAPYFQKPCSWNKENGITLYLHIDISHHMNIVMFSWREPPYFATTYVEDIKVHPCPTIVKGIICLQKSLTKFLESHPLKSQISIPEENICT